MNLDSPEFARGGGPMGIKPNKKANFTNLTPF